jgi:hypothetical protein
MKNFNRRNSHGHHGSKRRELAQHAHSRGSHAFTHTLTSTQLQPRGAKRQLSYYRIWNRFLFEGTWGRGSKPEYPEKTPDSLSANRYHILEEKIQRPGRESNPHPPTSVISSLGQEDAPRLTHWATDRRSLGFRKSHATSPPEPPPSWGGVMVVGGWPTVQF